MMGSSPAAALLLFPLFFSFFAPAEGQGGRSPARHIWCVAKNNAGDGALRSAIDWACGAGGADCGPIQQGGRCYDAADLRRTASFAFNDYFVEHGPSDDNCNFGGAAALTSLDPSRGNCTFQASSVDGNFSQVATADSGGSPDLTITTSRSGIRNRKLLTSDVSTAVALLILLPELRPFLAAAFCVYRHIPAI